MLPLFTLLIKHLLFVKLYKSSDYYYFFLLLYENKISNYEIDFFGFKSYFHPTLATGVQIGEIFFSAEPKSGLHVD